MRSFAVFILVIALSSLAFAETTEIIIPGEGWKISFDSPILSNKQESRKGLGYAVRGNSGRFNLSLFVEEPHGEGKSNKDIYNYYWSHASRNPLIVKETVVTSDTPQYVRVQYDILAEFQGQYIRHKNINYYFVYMGRWVDVHISVIDPKNEDEKIFSAFDKSLTYGVVKPSSPVTHAQESTVRSYPLPQHGILELVVPSSWKDSIEQPRGDLPPTINFVPETGGQFELLVTPLWSEKNGENINEPSKIKTMVTSNGQSVLPSATEKELNVLELKNGESVGYYYVVTDKAPKPGEFPIMAQGAISVGNLLLSFTLIENQKDSNEQRTALNMLINGKQKK